MVIGLGTDLVDIRRIADVYARFGTRFVRRILSPREQSIFEAHRQHDPALYLAGRFAAKEALAKALGQGFRGGLSMRDFVVLTNEVGQPFVEYEGVALTWIQEKGVRSTLISITHEKMYAMAVCLLSG